MQNLIICYEYTSDFNSAWNMVQEYVQAYPEDASAQREYIFLKKPYGTGSTCGEYRGSRDGGYTGSGRYTDTGRSTDTGRYLSTVKEDNHRKQ